MKKYDKNKILILILSIVLLSSSVALAYQFNTLKSVTNIFSFSNEIWAEFTEPNWQKQKALAFVPGMTVRKDPMLTNLSEDKNIYGAIRVRFQHKDEELMSDADTDKLISLLTIDWNVGEGEREWRKVDDLAGSSSTQIFIYNKELIPGEVSVPLFNTVKMKTESEGLTEKDLRWLQKMNIEGGEISYDLEGGIGEFRIELDGSIVHALPFDSAQDASQMLVSLFPDG